jgi:AAA+ ATPase superfamily predicted ATPase
MPSSAMTGNATEELFPRGIATGRAFCNREQERAVLSAHILAARPRHTWISARRRHGKSSLIAQVLLDLKSKRRRVEHASLDVFVVHNLKTLDEALREAIGTLSGRLLPRRKRALDYLGKAFASFRPELALGAGGVKLKLSGDAPSAARIDAMLRALDEAAAHYETRGVLVIDEFQQIARLDEGHAVEGALRSVAQSARALSFVFLGSERTLLAQMFENRDRPLYMLCKHLELGRIATPAYGRFLNDAARLQWHAPLDEAVLGAILTATARHPFYVNALARALWDGRGPPTLQSVEEAWAALLAEESERFKAQLLSIPHLTRAVFKELSASPTATPTAQSVLTALELSVGTVSGAVKWLEERDLLWRDDEEVLRPVDPLMGLYLQGL